MGMVKKYNIALYLNKGTSSTPEWVRVKKSTAFDLSLNPETEEYDYIADESPTQELKKYKPTLNQSLTMYTDEDDYKFIFDKFYNLAVGSDAKSEVLIIFFQEPTTGGKYKAWKSECSLVVSDLNSVDSTITFDINFGGTVAKGTAEADSSGDPTFTPAA